jgi:hypothetical protein
MISGGDRSTFFLDVLDGESHETMGGRERARSW